MINEIIIGHSVTEPSGRENGAVRAFSRCDVDDRLEPRVESITVQSVMIATQIDCIECRHRSNVYSDDAFDKKKDNTHSHNSCIHIIYKQNISGLITPQTLAAFNWDEISNQVQHDPALSHI